MAVAEPDYLLCIFYHLFSCRGSYLGSPLPTPHASTPWSGPNPPTSEVSCFLLTLFIIWIVWVNYFNLQQVTSMSQQSLQCPLFASSSVSAKSVFSNEICYECVMIKISGIPRLPLFVARDPMAIRQKMAISSGNGAINWWKVGRSERWWYIWWFPRNFVSTPVYDDDIFF